MRVVIDTNCLLVSLSSRSRYHWLYRALVQQRFELAVSNEILTEYVEIIQRYFDETTRENAFHLLTHAENVLRTEVHFLWQLIEADPDDNKFVDCAFAANVDYLVTNDSDYGVLKTVNFPRVRVVSLPEFEQILNDLTI